MEKGVIALLATGLIGLLLFLSFSQSHDAQRSTISAQQGVDSAKFDRDFAEAQGKPTAEHDKEVAEAQKRLTAARNAQALADAQRQAQMSALKVETEASMATYGVDVSKIKSQVNAIGDKK